MKKNKCLFKLFSALVAIFTTCSTGVFNSSVNAASSIEIIEDCLRFRLGLSPEEICFIDGCGLDSYDAFIKMIEADPYASGFRADHGKSMEMIDSVNFLFFINFINSAHTVINKNALIKRLISLRETEECRNDRYYVTEFDAVFGTNLKAILTKYSPRTIKAAKATKTTKGTKIRVK